MVLLSYNFLWKIVPFQKKIKTEQSEGMYVRNLLMKGFFKYLNDRFPYPFIYHRENGTPFGRILHV